MYNFQISFMEKNDIQESARVLSVAMLNNPLHVAVFQGEGEKERIEIEKMFCELFIELPGIVFLAKEKQNRCISHQEINRSICLPIEVQRQYYELPKWNCRKDLFPRLYR